MSIGSKVHIIAEAGTNHGGRRETACQLIDVAADAGADSVKFQLLFPDGLYLPEFFENGAYRTNDVYQKRLAGMITGDDFRRLVDYSTVRSLPISASIFDRESLDCLLATNPPYVKIASCDLNNDPLLSALAERQSRVVLATGMSSLGEIEHAVDLLRRGGTSDVVLLHCVSVYPCPVERMNLAFLSTLRSAFGLPIGLSDHTESSLASAMAIALGATWIEKHFTLDRKADGFDHAYAMDPPKLTAFIADLRQASAALEPQAEKVGPSEAIVRGRARRALYAARDLSPGQILTERDVLVVRPEGPLSPGDLPKILGRPLAQAVPRLAPFELGSVCWSDAPVSTQPQLARQL